MITTISSNECSTFSDQLYGKINSNFREKNQYQTLQNID